MERRTKGSLNTRLHAMHAGQDLPVVLLFTEEQSSGQKGALLMPALPPADVLFAGRAYDSSDFLSAPATPL